MTRLRALVLEDEWPARNSVPTKSVRDRAQPLRGALLANATGLRQG